MVLFCFVTARCTPSYSLSIPLSKPSSATHLPSYPYYLYAKRQVQQWNDPGVGAVDNFCPCARVPSKLTPTTEYAATIPSVPPRHKTLELTHKPITACPIRRVAVALRPAASSRRGSSGAQPSHRGRRTDSGSAPVQTVSATIRYQYIMNTEGLNGLATRVGLHKRPRESAATNYRNITVSPPAASSSFSPSNHPSTPWPPAPPAQPQHSQPTSQDYCPED